MKIVSEFSSGVENQFSKISVNFKLSTLILTPVFIKKFLILMSTPEILFTHMTH